MDMRRQYRLAVRRDAQRAAERSNQAVERRENRCTATGFVAIIECVRMPRQIQYGFGDTVTAPESMLPVVVTLDDTDSPRDIIDALALSPFATGREPYATSVDLVNVREDATLLPPGVLVVRECATKTERARLAVGDGWTLRTVYWPRTNTASVSVSATSAELGEEIIKLATDGMTQEPDAVDEAVSMGFWYTGGHGPQRNPRDIMAGTWA